MAARAARTDAHGADRRSCLNQPTCFKAYDIRGRIPDELNEDIAYRIGRAYAELLIRPRSWSWGTTSGCPARRLPTAPDAAASPMPAWTCSTSVCAAPSRCISPPRIFSAGGGIMVTASHNPADYNGMKLVREESRPISGDSRSRRDQAPGREAERQPGRPTGRRGGRSAPPMAMRAYVQHLLELRRMVVTCGRSSSSSMPATAAAGPVIDALERTSAVPLRQDPARARTARFRTACRTRCFRRNRR